RLALRHHHHAAWAAGAVALAKGAGQKFAAMALVGVADEQRAAQAVVADDRLEVAAGGFDGGEGEGNAAVEQRDGDVPGDGELARDPAAGLGPGALGVGAGAIVTD